MELRDIDYTDFKKTFREFQGETKSKFWDQQIISKGNTKMIDEYIIKSDRAAADALLSLEKEFSQQNSKMTIKVNECVSKSRSIALNFDNIVKE